MSSRNEFHELPAVRAYRDEIGDERYHRQLDIIEWEPAYVLQLLTLRNAITGTLCLAAMADDYGYCTARVMSFNARWNDDLAASTLSWLKKHQFPMPDHVLFCDGIQAKLETIAEQLLKDPEMFIVLIDDSVESLLSAFAGLNNDEQQVLAQRFTLVGFGLEGKITGPFKIISMFDWSEVEVVISLLDKKEIEYAVVGQEKQQ